MKIDLGHAVEFDVVLGDKHYKLREPKLHEVKKFEKDESDNAFIDFVVDLGMPRDVAEGLGVISLKKLAEGLTGAMSEKK